METNKLNRYGIIYKVVNKHDGKVYIGQTIRTVQERWNSHVKRSKQDNNNKFMKAIREYGKDNFTLHVLYTAFDIDELCTAERQFIELFDSMNCGYNSNLGGVKNTGCSDETRALISEINIGRVVSQETREKLRKAMLGKRASKETKIKMSKAHIGKKRNLTDKGRNILRNKMLGDKNPVHSRGEISKETRIKMSNWQKGGNNNQAKKVRNKTTNEQFETIKEAALSVSGHFCSLGKAINNKKKYKGFEWEIVSE